MMSRRNWIMILLAVLVVLGVVWWLLVGRLAPTLAAVAYLVVLLLVLRGSEYRAAMLIGFAGFVLHLAEGRRLYGWPEEWPDHPDSGHFLIDQPEWLLDDGRRAPLYNVEKTLVPASDVEMVEFLKTEEEIGAEPQQVEDVKNTMLELQRKENDHGE